MNDQVKLVGQLVAKCWADEGFKKKLKSDPKAALKDMGFNVPANMNFQILEDSDTLTHIIIPAKPTKELSDAQLDKVAGGGTWGTIGSACIATAGTAYCAG